uniref:neuron navigator 3-like isoform X1 n=1 Tax=Styela clava TaxID=7725 RepID=UPI00193A55F4|nr:neuron navigator 3-like isoform X1 [Styela clava]
MKSKKSKESLQYTQEDELSKLRRAIEDQRLKAERVDISGKGQSGGGYSPFSNHGSNSTGQNHHNTTGSPETESVYPVFVPPEQHDHWSSAASTVSGLSAESTLTRNNVDNISPDSSINKRVSSGSLSSVSSHISGSSSSTGSSGPEVEAAMKQSKKKRWVRLPLKSFSKTSKSQSSSQPDLLDSEDSGCPLSPTLSRRNLHTTGSVGSSSESEAIQELLQVVQEKERKLTDIRLEALTSQHQIHQLKEQITQMQNEMQLLRLENERLQATVESNCQTEERTNTPLHATSKTLSRTTSSGLMKLSHSRTDSRGSNRSLSCNQSPVTSPMHHSKYPSTHPTAFETSFPPIDCRNLQNTLSPDSESEGFQVRFLVTSSSTMLPGKRSIVIGSLPVPRRATWEELDRVSQTILTEYCRVLDGESRLGLSTASIESYQVGDLKREIGGKTPDLLPCAYIVGDVDTVEIKLKDASQGCSDQMAFDLLISRDTLDCYISLLLQHGRIILEGPAGTGKTSFAMSLSEYLVARLRAEGGNTMVSVIDVMQDGEEKIQRYISDLTAASRNGESPSVPAVLVVENLHLLSSVSDALNQLVTLCGSHGRSPYIIGTMLPLFNERSETHRDFRLISCSCDSPHVQRYLTRALRRSLVDHILTSSNTCARENSKLSSIVLWIPLCWQHINRFLELQNAQYAYIGPKMFLKTPMNVASSCNWFVGLWNRSIVPHLTTAIRSVPLPHGNAWEDPSKWVINSFPWDSCETAVNPAKTLCKVEPPNPQDLPRYPSVHENLANENIEDLPLPPPPVPVRSPTNSFRTPCATSSPIKTASRSSNGCMNSYTRSNSNDNIWQRQTGSNTLTRSPAHTSSNTHRHFHTVGSKPQKYSRAGSTGLSEGEDPLKSMLAQLKQSALSTSKDDFNTTPNNF